jgi:hypothetical protein
VSYFNPKTAPSVFDVVWCAYPNRERPGQPGQWVRPVLVLDARLMVDAEGVEFSAITAAYGTDADKVPQNERTNHLLIGNAEYRALRLHKPTVFKLDVRNRKRMPWSPDYFMPQGYVDNQTVIAGLLTDQQQTTVKDCLKARGLSFPLP